MWFDSLALVFTGEKKMEGAGSSGATLPGEYNAESGTFPGRLF